ncbi:TetR/AcrR family transcriptional regulator [Paenibacillus sp. PK3_47]|uniref:TetR/AcrR family transcriptional regulator n=1 Tax=Paenibacillus sp. PK3_47 TaxID=2072642 RepID=UPI00201E54DC|nr:TetR/AcrR family transcriptional regulator [Paenibacillus sp. PK3_47]UQZ32733.1 TetR/AcrR family transcriptional regulator [Paenibacillus sp. PK3_47]
MARNKDFDTTQVLHKAMQIFGHYGYEGTSLQILLEGLGIARQSMYDTYGTKKELFVKAVRHYLNEKSSAVVVYLQQKQTVKQAIGSIFNEIVAALQDEDRRKECFILHSAIDQVPHNSDIALMFEKDKLMLEQAFYDALVRAQHEGEISEKKDLHAIAQYLYHSRYALTQVAKLTADPKALNNVAALTLSVLED